MEARVEPQEDGPGERLGRYRLVHRLAVGGMGEVFLARHEGPAGFTKTLVVKRILPHFASDARFVELFLNEARLAALLSHPNVVQIFELGEDNGLYFIAMEYIAGKSLRAVSSALSRRGEMIQPTLAARIAAQALNGLHYAHQLTDNKGRPLGIVHRDVSPDNVLLGLGGAVKVLDFGVAKAVAAAREHTRTLRGKYAYMPPEQFKSEVLDRRADVYAMGVLLYELLTGQLPYLSVDPLKLLEEKARPPPPPSSLRGEIPPELNQIVLSAIHPEPAERFQTAEDMAEALSEYASRFSETITAGQMDGFLRNLFGDLSFANDNLAPRRTKIMAEELAPSTDLEGRRGARKWGLTRQRASISIAALAAALIAFTGLSWALRSRPASEPDAEPPSQTSRSSPAPELAAVPPRARLPPAAGPESRKPSLPQETRGPSSPAEGEKAPEPARRPAGTAKANKPAPKLGRVQIRVHPWAEVLLANKNFGTTPLPALSVPAGRQTFTLRNRDLNVERQVTVTVMAGREVQLNANLLSEPPAN